MGKASLVIMAAGIGSRFGGGIKQLEPVGPNGEIIMDYSIFDAIEAGFDKVVFVIRKDLEKDFKEVIGDRISRVVNVAYAFQEIEDIPEQYQDAYSERVKPWGTGQAILVCKDIVKEPFLIINADDYYGKEAYVKAFQYLSNMTEEKAITNISMVGFELGNTLSENGGVTRGVCKTDDNNHLIDIVETKNIIKTESGAAVDTAVGLIDIEMDTPVSMNMWGVTPHFMKTLEEGFTKFLSELDKNDLTSEYLLPTIIGDLLAKKQMNVDVLRSVDKWFGVTYKEDKASVVMSVQNLIETGVYPKNLY